VTESRPTAAARRRRFTLGSGPLKRRSDRLEFLARVVLVGALLAAVVVALAVARTTYVHARAEAAVEAADRHRVTAHLVADAPMPATETGDTPDMEQAAAVWTDTAGIQRPVTVSVLAGARAGSATSVWIDDQGRTTPRPLTEGDVTGRSVGQGLGTVVGLAMLLFGAYGFVLLLLDRSRSRRWAADWEVVEPVWMGRVP
jgi:hypothetical protein